jgi:hypothetical protein
MFRNHTIFNGPAGLDLRQVKMTWLKLLAHWADDAIRVPGTRFRIGGDGLIGLIPVIGNVAGTLFSAYIVREAARLGVSNRTLWKMSANVLADTLIGAVPVIGNLADFVWKANARNIVLMEQDLATDPAKSFAEPKYAQGEARFTQPDSRPRRAPVTIDAE